LLKAQKRELNVGKNRRVTRGKRRVNRRVAKSRGGGGKWKTNQGGVIKLINGKGE